MCRVATVGTLELNFRVWGVGLRGFGLQRLRVLGFRVWGFRGLELTP